VKRGRASTSPLLLAEGLAIVTVLAVLTGSLAAAAGRGSPLLGIHGDGTYGDGTYGDGPPPGHTGGFGEPTCVACHFDGGVNEGPGRVSVEGLPGGAVGGDDAGPLELHLVVEDPDLVRGGFQLPARWAEGPEKGASAGTLAPSDGRTELSRGGAGDVTYLHQSEVGTEPTREGVSRWSFRWSPPGAWSGPVVFHVAANAANGDVSEFGDRIYADSFVVKPRP